MLVIWEVPTAIATVHGIVIRLLSFFFHCSLQDAVKLGEVEVQGPPAPPAGGSGMTSPLLEEESEGESKKPGCCKLCCFICYQRCCGVIIV